MVTCGKCEKHYFKSKSNLNLDFLIIIVIFIRIYVFKKFVLYICFYYFYLQGLYELCTLNCE